MWEVEAALYQISPGSWAGREQDKVQHRRCHRMCGSSRLLDEENDERQLVRAS